MEAKMNNHHEWVRCTSPDILIGYFEDLLEKSGFDVISETHHFFHPFGFTALYLLGESHFAIHTFPEKGMTYIELSSCVDDPFDRFMEEYDADALEEIRYEGE